MPLTRRHQSIIEICTNCKGRLSHLQQALPTWIKQQHTAPFAITVLDYNCPDNTAAWLLANLTEPITALTYRSPSPWYSQCHAHNLCARDSTADVLVFIDADNLLAPDWLPTAVDDILANKADYSETFWTEGSPNRGTCAVRRSLLTKIRGWDEALHGYGDKDRDLYIRLSKHGRKSVWDITKLTTISHPDADRVRYAPDPDREASTKLNAIISATRGES